ncbi:MAG: hypothetical protein ACRDUX_23890 [Mycobacterium sp.]
MTEPADSKRASVNKIFGDSLPETTKDEWDERPSDGDAERDRWLRDNVPPHHG